MNIRFYLDPETGLPHIYRHEVSEAEVEEVLRRSGEDLMRTQNKASVDFGASGWMFWNPRNIYPKGKFANATSAE
jgi:hypothetical protein